MLKFTFDTNCIIAVDENRSESIAIQELVLSHKNKIASVGIAAISASEQQKDGHYLENFTAFKKRLLCLGLDGLDLLEPMFYYDVTFWDFSLDSNNTMASLESEIHKILFPKIQFLWADYCAELDLDPQIADIDKKWINAKCDVQAFWSHAYRKRDIFVTSDQNFHAKTKKQLLLSLSGGQIETPEAAAKLKK